MEKFGYGFSDVANKSRDIDSILEDTRTALKEAGLTAPYVLCPHSMSGLEALYWANKYPDEFVTLPFVAGRVHNKKTGKYEETHRIQIKYDEKKGAHVFPVLENKKC